MYPQNKKFLAKSRVSSESGKSGKIRGKELTFVKIGENQGKNNFFSKNQGKSGNFRFSLVFVVSLSNFRHYRAIIIHLLRIEFLPKFLVYIVHHLRKIREIREFSCKFGLKNQGKSGNLFVKSC